MTSASARLIVFTGVAIGAVVWLLVLSRWRALRSLDAPAPTTVTARDVSLEEAERGVLELALARQWQCVAREGGTIVFRLPPGAGVTVRLHRPLSRNEA